MNKRNFCLFCGSTEDLTVHHVIPKHARKRNSVSEIKRIIRQEYHFKNPKTIRLCRSCHIALHSYFTNEELAFNSLWKLIKENLNGIRTYARERKQAVKEAKKTNDE